MPSKMAVYISYIDEMGSPVYNRNDLDGEVHELCKLYEERGDDSEEACRQLGFTMQMYNAAKALLAKK